MPAHRTNPAFFRQDHGNRLALHRYYRRYIYRRRRRGDFGAAQQSLQILQFLAECFVLALDFHLFQAAQAAQPHVQNGLGLHVGQLEHPDQPSLGVVLLANDPDHLVQIQENLKETIKDLQPLLDRRQPVRAAAD